MVNQDRSLYFQLHIRPMFRASDRDNMLSRFDLWDEGYFYSDAGEPHMIFIQRLFNRLDRSITDHDLMPPRSHSGPWPKEWLDIYQRWMDEGCRRLSMGDGYNYDLFRSGSNRYALSVNVKIPDNSQAWFQRKYEGPSSLIYELFVQNEEKPSTVEEKWIEENIIVRDETISSITVLDANGRKKFLLSEAS